MSSNSFSRKRIRQIPLKCLVLGDFPLERLGTLRHEEFEILAVVFQLRLGSLAVGHITHDANVRSFILHVVLDRSDGHFGGDGLAVANTC
ncbi:MAG: hypothetical protein U5O39_06055 [Gammaproteobacteria bacterium]|nr:hypothetical protein [Gammaproteobacteria bacterium]